MLNTSIHNCTGIFTKDSAPRYHNANSLGLVVEYKDRFGNPQQIELTLFGLPTDQADNLCNALKVTA